MESSWLWLKDESNNRAVAAVLQVVTMMSAFYFGYQGLNGITELNLNLKELKAESIEAERAKIDGSLQIGCQEGQACIRFNGGNGQGTAR
jgi:hypothetical protein